MRRGRITRWMAVAGCVMAMQGAFAFRGMIDIRDFGAVGDGGTDDSAAVRAAMLHAKETNNHAVFFPKGEWRVNWDVVLEGGVLARSPELGPELGGYAWGLYGVPGQGLFGGSDSVIVSSGTLRLHSYVANVNNLSFRGDSRNRPDAPPGIVLKNMAYFFQCHFGGFGTAVQFSEAGRSPYGAAFTQCTFHGNGRALYFSTGVPNNEMHFSQCRLTQNRTAIHAGGGGNITFEQCYIEHNGRAGLRGVTFDSLRGPESVDHAGIYIGDGASVTIQNSWIEHNTTWIDGALTVANGFVSTNAGFFSSSGDLTFTGMSSTGELLGNVEPELGPGLEYRGMTYVSAGEATTDVMVHDGEGPSAMGAPFHHRVRRFTSREPTYLRFYNMGVNLRVRDPVRLSFPIHVPASAEGPLEYSLYYFDEGRRIHRLLTSVNDDVNRGKALERGVFWNYTYAVLPRFDRGAEIRGIVLEIKLPASPDEEILVGLPSFEMVRQRGAIPAPDFAPAHGHLTARESPLLYHPSPTLFDHVYLSPVDTPPHLRERNEKLIGFLESSDIARVPDRPYRRGDILFAGAPEPGEPVGWVCVEAGRGSEARWRPFGRVE